MVTTALTVDIPGMDGIWDALNTSYIIHAQSSDSKGLKSMTCVKSGTQIHEIQYLRGLVSIHANSTTYLYIDMSPSSTTGLTVDVLRCRVLRYPKVSTLRDMPR